MGFSEARVADREDRLAVRKHDCPLVLLCLLRGVADREDRLAVWKRDGKSRAAPVYSSLPVADREDRLAVWKQSSSSMVSNLIIKLQTVKTA